jgi:hypothetical protein
MYIKLREFREELESAQLSDRENSSILDNEYRIGKHELKGIYEEMGKIKEWLWINEADQK